MVAIVTSLMAPPLLRFTLSHVPIGEEEARRLEREATAATSFAQSIRRVLVVAREAESSRGVSSMLDRIASVQPIEVAAIYADLRQEAVSPWRYFSAQARASANEIKQRLRNLRRELRETGRGVDLKVAMGESAADQVLVEARKGYDLVAMAVDISQRHDGMLFGPVIDRVVREAPCHTLLVKPALGVADAPPIRSILVPVKGTEYEAVELASLVALGANAKVTFIHVISETEEPLPGDTMLRDRQQEIGVNLVEQHTRTARKLGCEVSGRVVRAGSPEVAIPEIARREGFDLVVVGASSRNMQLRAYLGRRVETLLSDTDCSVAIVCAPS
jgi:nucleotide-binding universal stress UspA family protein